MLHLRARDHLDVNPQFVRREDGDFPAFSLYLFQPHASHPVCETMMTKPAITTTTTTTTAAQSASIDNESSKVSSSKVDVGDCLVQFSTFHQATILKWSQKSNSGQIRKPLLAFGSFSMLTHEASRLHLKGRRTVLAVFNG